MFKRILLAADASDNAIRAVDYVIKLCEGLPPLQEIDVHLLNVRRPLPGDVGMFVAKEQMRDYHRERGMQALERARARLDERKAAYSYHLLVGPPWQQICHYAKEKQCDLIVMGRRGVGTFTGGAIGSVALRTLQLVEQPVLLIA